MAKRDMGTRTMTNSEIQDRTCVRPSFRSRGCCRTGQPRRPVGERRSWRLRACACRKSNSHIQMMKSAKKWRRQNATNGMYCSRRRRVLVD